MIRIGSTGFAEGEVRSVDDIVPRTAVPVVVSNEAYDSRPFDIDSHVPIVRKLIQVVGGIRRLVAAAPVVRAPDKRLLANSQDGPTLPLQVGIVSYGNGWNLLGAA